MSHAPTDATESDMTSAMAASGRATPCACDAPSPPPPPPPAPDCRCARDGWGIVQHDDTCLLYKHETIIHPHEPSECECNEEAQRVCPCCSCLEDQCLCRRAGREALDEWREGRALGAMPAVLESTHPLMQKFQDSLKKFLQKENDLAVAEIVTLRDELKSTQTAYDRDLESIYINDHNTNAQRTLIKEYEETLARERAGREEAERRARTNAERHRQCLQQLDKSMANDQDARQELEALEALVRQLEAWREETEAELNINQKITAKMRKEKMARADEKRQLDLVILSLNNEIWKMQSRIELFKNQIEIKNVEFDKVSDRVIAYSTELEDLELDMKRLSSLWNSVLVNIKQRDRVYNSVREDYATLKENYRTLVVNLEITKKMVTEEMQRGKELAMNRDKIGFDVAAVTNAFNAEDERRAELEASLAEIREVIDMTERDTQAITMENNTMRNILSTTANECDRLVEQKVKMENQIIANIQECLLNDKAVQHMAAGIKKIRDMSRKLEIGLMTMENQHAKVMLDIEMYRSKRANQQISLDKTLAKVAKREKEIEALNEQYEQNTLLMLRKQRELDIVLKKFNALKDIFDMKSPQEREIEALENQIKQTRDRTEKMQHIWLRLQGHVVRLTAQHQKLNADILLINKQVQICDQKVMQTTAQIEEIRAERNKVERSLRELHGRLEVLQRTKKECRDKVDNTHHLNTALTQEYSANLKGAEAELFEMEEQIDNLDKEKMDLTQELDRVQKETMIWQRKGILAVELKRSIHDAKSAAGEIGQMKNEIHRMEVRREQLRKTADKLSEDLATYVSWRETALERTRASAAVEKAKGLPGGATSQASYKHKLRLVRADVQRVTKDVADTKLELKDLLAEQAELEKQIKEATEENRQLEENVASLLRECRKTESDKQYILERVVRSQRLGGELARAVKRQSLRIRKPKDALLADHTRAQALNDRLQHIVETLSREYPYLEEKLATIGNTLNIYSPTGSPRLTEEQPCRDAGPHAAPRCFPDEPACAGRCADRCLRHEAERDAADAADAADDSERSVTFDV